MIDLRSLRPNNLTSPQFSHLLWVLYWPAYGIAFGALEFLRPAADCFSVHCRVDDLIPFCEYFFIPYLFWFVFLVGMNVYLALWEPKSFRKFMHFVAFTYTLTLLIYVVWPTKQDLRPTEFVRDNFFTRFPSLLSLRHQYQCLSLPPRHRLHGRGVRGLGFSAVFFRILEMGVLPDRNAHQYLRVLREAAFFYRSGGRTANELAGLCAGLQAAEKGESE